jgi:hypothetical protein
VQAVRACSGSPRPRCGPSGANATDVYQVAALTPREPELGNAGGPFGGEADDHEALALDAFDLEPVFGAPGTVWRIGALRQDALDAHSDRSRVQLRTIREMLAIDDAWRLCAGFVQQVFEHAFALDERRGARVESFEV